METLPLLDLFAALGFRIVLLIVGFALLFSAIGIFWGEKVSRPVAMYVWMTLTVSEMLLTVSFVGYVALGLRGGAKFGFLAVWVSLFLLLFPWTVLVTFRETLKGKEKFPTVLILLSLTMTVAFGAAASGAVQLVQRLTGA